jgi:GNAT superfamily N-acetyltransferase
MRIEYPSESIALRHFEPHALIAQISVHPEMRNRGIGSEMLREAERLARDSCVGLIVIYGYAVNPAVWLYHRAGFVDIPMEHRKDRNPKRAYLWKRFNPLRAEWLE